MQKTIVLTASSQSTSSLLSAAEEFMRENPIYTLIDWAAGKGAEVILTLKERAGGYSI